MEIQYSKDSIILKNKSLSNVDKFVLDFVDILKNHFRYVIVSGYVAILFGRSRGTEDIEYWAKYFKIQAKLDNLW